MALSKKICIIGAGLAGLSAAISLAKAGLSVTIIEKASKLKEIGAGLQLSPNVSKILAEWQILKPACELAVAPDNLLLYDGYEGKIIYDLPIKKLSSERWHAPYLTIHRADLQNLLLKTAQADPLIELYLGSEVEKYELKAEQISLTLNLQGHKQRRSFAYLLCCDGVWSPSRAHLCNHEQPQFSNYIAWRASFKREELSPFIAKKDKLQAWCGPQRHVVIYPIRANDYYNIVAIVKHQDPQNLWPNANEQDISHQLSRDFYNWHEDLQKIFTQQSGWSYWPIFTRPTIRLSCQDNIYFLGDASHALLPFAAQGAAMAIEDSYILGQLIANISQKCEIRRHYYQLRYKRLKAVSKRTDLNGWIYHQSAIFALTRNYLLKFISPQLNAKALDWLYGYDAKKELAGLS